jgi:hypothetical protein
MDIITPLCLFFFRLTVELEHPQFGQVVNPIPISSFLLILQSTRFVGKPDVLRQQKLTLIF